MLFSNLLFNVLLVLFIHASLSAFNATSNNNMGVYWGQNSAGSQNDLSDYCDSDIDIFLLAFMNIFPGNNDVPGLNFANKCDDTFSNGLLHCTTIGSNIKDCQEKGKKVLLSLGGAIGDYGFTSDSEAEDFADTLWKMFGEGESETRPFDDAIIDGFDLDLENQQQTGYPAMISRLRELFNNQNNSKSDYYISAAPQCVYPDASLNNTLLLSDIDFVFIQFYNNYCDLDKSDFNWDIWSNYAKDIAKNLNTKIYVGLPGSTTAAGSGYVDLDIVNSTLVSNSVLSDPYFGGFMVWDASQGFSNMKDGTNYIEQLISILKNSSDLSSSPTTIASKPRTRSSSSFTTNSDVRTTSTIFVTTIASSSSSCYTTNSIVRTTTSTSSVTSSSRVPPSSIVITWLPPRPTSSRLITSSSTSPNSTSSIGLPPKPSSSTSFVTLPPDPTSLTSSFLVSSSDRALSSYPYEPSSSSYTYDPSSSSYPYETSTSSYDPSTSSYPYETSTSSYPYETSTNTYETSTSSYPYETSTNTYDPSSPVAPTTSAPLTSNPVSTSTSKLSTTITSSRPSPSMPSSFSRTSGSTIFVTLTTIETYTSHITSTYTSTSTHTSTSVIHETITKNAVKYPKFRLILEQI